MASCRPGASEYKEAVADPREIAAECRQRSEDVGLHSVITHSVLAEALSVTGSVMAKLATEHRAVLDAHTRVLGEAHPDRRESRGCRRNLTQASLALFSFPVR